LLNVPITTSRHSAEACRTLTRFQEDTMLRSLATLARPLITLGLLLSVTGCSASRHTLLAPTQPVPDDSRVTIAVVPFTSTFKKDATQEERNLKQFESYFFTARLVDTLAASPFVAGAYVAPDSTPAVDYVVTGSIVESNGEDTKIRVSIARLGTKPTPPKLFTLDLSSSDYAPNSPDPSTYFWISVANSILGDVAALDAQQRATMSEARLAQYAPTGSSARARPLIDEAAGIERDRILKPITDLTLSQCRAATPAYVTWQRETTKLAEESRSKKTVATMGTVLAIAGAAVAGMNQGMYGASPTSMQLTQNSHLMMLTSMREFDQAGDIDAKIAHLHSAFSTETSALTVTYDDAVYDLVGSPKDQMRQFRTIVTRKLSQLS
jgi:hypothetical protein